MAEEFSTSETSTHALLAQLRSPAGSEAYERLQNVRNDLKPAEPGPGPEKSASLLQNQARLQQALTSLSSHQRLLIKLRYQQDLSLKEVARLTRLGDPFRARRHIQAALDQLSKYFKD